VLGGARRAAARFDERVEVRVERLRGHRVLDRLFYAASELGEWSLIWFLIGLLQALLPGRDPLSVLRLAVIMGIESGLVNGPIKQLFRRSRPAWTSDEPRPHHLRIPVTSSFPSGHASAAFCAAVVLTAGGDPLWPVYFVVAAVVAFSRCFGRIHHASDVVGGVVVGVLLGLLANHLWPPY
jgi:undecaprenyl-diphosphatase